MSETRVQVVERAIDILLVLADGPATLTEVTRATGLPKGTAFRILSGLRYQNVVVKDPVGSAYQLGPGFLRLSHAQLHEFGTLTTMAKPALLALWQRTEETVALHVRIGADRVCIDEIPSPHNLRYSALVGVPAPISIGSAAKVLLAAMSERDSRRLVDALELSRVTDTTIVDRDELVDQVEHARREGYAESDGELVAGASAISVPVRVLPDVTAALSVLGPATRLTREKRLSFLDDLRAAAKAIEEAASFESIAGPKATRE